MKTTNASILARLASRQYTRVELFTITPLNGSGAVNWTSYDAPLTVGGTTWITGMVIKRGPISQEIGLQVPTLEVTMLPKADSPNSTSVSGFPFLTAVRLGLLRNADFQLFRNFLLSGVLTAAPPFADLPNVPWFRGRITDFKTGRQGAQLTVSGYTDILNVQMPRNLIQAECFHTVYDAGCTLLKSAFTVTGSVSSVSGDSTSIFTALTQVDHYFDRGVLTFTSGALNGFSRVVKKYLNASGEFDFTTAAPGVQAGDTFSVYPGCPKTQAACSNTSTGVGPAFNNLVHYGGKPYVPVPETLYDGGTTNPPLNPRGGHLGQLSGSGGSSSIGRNYVP